MFFFSLRYDFVAYPPGTHVYHSHYGKQRADGLSGTLIVKVVKQAGVVYVDWP